MTALHTTPGPASNRNEPQAARSARRGRRFLAAGLVAAAGLLIAATWTVSGVLSAMNASDDFVRAALPGALTVQITEVGTHYVYYEGDYDSDLPGFDELQLRATGPGGAIVDVEPYDFQMEYDAHGGLLGTAVATVEADRPGTYTIRATATEPDARLAWGDSVAGRLTTPLVGSGAVLLLAAAAATALVVRAVRTR